jgi:CBS-domain-containing membrane protein
MTTLMKPLFDLTADDLMSRDLVTIPRKMSLQAAAHLLNHARISGAPVVDERECCIGVLTTSDLMYWVEKGEHASKCLSDLTGSMCTDWQLIDVAALPADEVARYMTTDLVTASPFTPLDELARKMVDADIHRILITDKLGRPVGIVTSTDILAALADKARRREQFGSENADF